MFSRNKLFQLKHWLTIPETAKHLSMIFDEEVSEADVLRLGLDGRLTLSVRFLNIIQATYGKIVSYGEIDWPVLRIEHGPLREDEVYPEDSDLENIIYLSDGRFLDLWKGDVRLIDGVWDLPMVGNERIDVEQKYQRLAGLKEVEIKFTEHSTFVEERGTGTVCQLLEEIDTKGCKEPAKGLPKDSFLVVCTRALLELQEKLTTTEEGNKAKVKQQVEAALLDPGNPFHAKELKIAVESWIELYYKNPPNCVPKGGHKKYIINKIEEKYPNLGQRALQRIATIINPNPKGGASPS